VVTINTPWRECAVSRRLSYGVLFAGVLALGTGAHRPVAAQSAAQPWTFVVSGDSRNCGDVVMPSIAGMATANNAAFYWHLGDLRYMLDFDDDMEHDTAIKQPMQVIQYLSAAWPDFIRQQIGPFGAMPFYVGIGNHETVFEPMFPGSRIAFINTFNKWLDTPTLKAQRLKDDPKSTGPLTYYHWIQGGVAFYNLDNATSDMFDDTQMGWFNRLLSQDVANADVKSIVVGAHAALPDSLVFDHSMSDYPQGVTSGRLLYRLLLEAKKAKNVYIVNSHFHGYVPNAYNSAYWQANGGVIPGWVVGTAGAYRYHMPPTAQNAPGAKEKTYGSLLATVGTDGSISFEFKPVNETDVPAAVVSKYTKDFVHYCFAENGEK